VYTCHTNDTSMAIDSVCVIINYYCGFMFFDIDLVIVEWGCYCIGVFVLVYSCRDRGMAMISQLSHQFQIVAS